MAGEGFGINMSDTLMGETGEYSRNKMNPLVAKHAENEVTSSAYMMSHCLLTSATFSRLFDQELTWKFPLIISEVYHLVCQNFFSTYNYFYRKSIRVLFQLLTHVVNIFLVTSVTEIDF